MGFFDGLANSVQNPLFLGGAPKWIFAVALPLLGAVGGLGGMVGWLWYLGTPLWIALVFVAAAMLVFIGVTRIVAEAGAKSHLTFAPIILTSWSAGYGAVRVLSGVDLSARCCTRAALVAYQELPQR